MTFMFKLCASFSSRVRGGKSPASSSRRWAALGLLVVAVAMLAPAPLHAQDSILTTVNVGSGPVAIAVNTTTNMIYVANSAANTLTVINGSTNTVVTTITVGTQPRAVLVNPSTNKIYVANALDDTIQVINGATNTTIATLVSGDEPLALGLNTATNTIYSVDFNDGDLTAINGTNDTVITYIEVGTNPSGIAVNPKTNKIYVANEQTIEENNQGSVMEIDGATNMFVTTITDPNNLIPTAIAVNTTTNKYYVANGASNNLTIINGADNSFTTVNVGGQPEGVAVNETTNKIYVSNFGGGSVTVIDGATNNTSTITVGTTPFTPGINATTNKIYVPNRDSNNITVIDGATATPTNLTTAGLAGPVAVTVDATTARTYVADAGSNNVAVIGGAAPAPGFSPSPSTIPFGNQTEGVQSSAMSTTITNSGSATLTISSVDVTGTNSGDFAVSSDSCTGANVAATSTCGVSVKFTPSTTAAESASLQFTDNATGSPQSVALTGTGTVAAPGFSPSPTSLAFGNQPKGAKSGAKSTTVTNNGTGQLTFSNVVLMGANSADFAISANTCTGNIAANGTCSVSVTFTPSTTAAESASIQFTDNAGGSPQSVGLTGTGTNSAPTAGLSVPSLTFSAQVVGSNSSTQSVTLTNSGNASLSVTSIAISGTNSGDFSQTNTCGTSVAAGSNCSVTVTFKPTASGTRTASVTYTDNASDSPQATALSGTATDFSFSVGNGSSTSQTVTAGQTATYNLQLGPVNGFSGTIALTCTGAPTGATCTPTPASIPVNGASSPFSVSVTTTAGSGGHAATALGRTKPPASLGSALLFVLSLLLVVPLVRREALTQRRKLAFTGCAAILLLASMALGGCSDRAMPVNAGTPAGNYTLMLTGTINGVSHSQPLTLVVN